MSFLQGKTPISYLQELCTKKGITPQYDLIANEGAVHEPTFVFKVRSGEFVGTGKGSSKKKAKHNAALNILTQMMGMGDEGVLQISEVGTVESLLPCADDPDPDGNPVGELQEMTQKRLWAPPSYEYSEEEDASPNTRDYICTVKVSTYAEVGKANSKKSAKRKAAYAMVQLLKRSLQGPQELNRPDFSEDRYVVALPQEEVESEFTKMISPKYWNCLSAVDKQIVVNFYNSITKESNELIAPDYEAMLKKLGKKFGMEITYIEFGEYTPNEEQVVSLYMVEVKLKKEKKPITCPGMGVSHEEAKSHAAAAALHHLALIKRGVWV